MLFLYVTWDTRQPWSHGSCLIHVDIKHLVCGAPGLSSQAGPKSWLVHSATKSQSADVMWFCIKLLHNKITLFAMGWLDIKVHPTTKSHYLLWDHFTWSYRLPTSPKSLNHVWPSTDLSLVSLLQISWAPNCGKPKYQNLLSPGGGFGPVAEDGYGVSYMVPGDLRIFFHVSSRRSGQKTSSKKFVETLESTMAEMIRLCGETASWCGRQTVLTRTSNMHTDI